MVEPLRNLDRPNAFGELTEPGPHETWDELARCSVEHDDVRPARKLEEAAA